MKKLYILNYILYINTCTLYIIHYISNYTWKKPKIKNSSIKDEKDDTDYPCFVDGGPDSLDSSLLLSRWLINY